MERVKGNPNRQQNVEMRRLINDTHAREQPLEILEQKIPVFKEAEHAQIHANAGDKPSLLPMSILCFSNLATEPEVHCRCRKQERGERRIPGPVKNVTRDDEQILAKVPAVQAPVKRRNDDVENDECERVEQHGQWALT